MENYFNLKIFSGLPNDVIERIILTAEERKYQTGEIIMMEGEESNGEGYIIKSGSVKITIQWQKIAELHNGDIFGEIALLNEEERSASVEAISDIEVIVLTLDHLIDMINNDENNINKEVMRRIEENIRN